MQYLIDGHNLIAQMADINLDEPDDEARLILRLRSWTAAGQKRRAIVFFDRGLPGGKSRELSSGWVRAIFAGDKKTADDLLISRVRQARNPGEITLVSSDREVIAAAKAKRMAFIRSEVFARMLAEREQPEAQAIRAEPPEPEPLLSTSEVDEWLALFATAEPKTPAGPKTEPTTADKLRQPGQAEKPDKAKAESGPKPAPEDPASLKSGARRMRSDELAEWLDLFGEEKRKK